MEHRIGHAMNTRRWLACAAAAFILLGCRERPQPVKAADSPAVPSRAATELMELVTPSVGVGEYAVVRFPRPLDAAGDRHWITLIEAGQADSQWGTWQYVDSTTREVTLAATTPGPHEIRLHDRYPAMPYHVVARSALTVTGPPAAAAVTAVAEAAPVTTPAVPAGDVAAMASTDYGSPVTRVEPMLHVQEWAKDGGGQQIVHPSGGHRFLVVEFPHTATQTGQIFYDSRQVFLGIGTDALKPFAVTTGGASSRRVFQREVWVSHYAPAPNLPFALVFQVPEGARGGTLKLGSRESALSW
jgi:hypothetical protein